MDNNIIEVKNLKVYFKLKNIFGKKKNLVVKAVDGVSFEIKEGEILSLVGESGSGKTTTGKALLQLVNCEFDVLKFQGKEMDLTKKGLNSFRQKAQMIYQDPYQSLNPRQQIIDIVTEPLEVNKLISSEEERLKRAKEALEQAGLKPGEDYFFRYPYELSGGQRQRVVIASSMIMSPKFIVADEPVSMLDASIRTGILKLMIELKEKNNLAYLFITHDLSLAWLISDRIAIMYLGKIMEIGEANIIINEGVHPYTKALIRVMPKAGVKRDGLRDVLEGEVPNPTSINSGCKFCNRCPLATEICFEQEPEMKRIGKNHYAACHKLEENSEE
ncbi:MAG: ABC transporter ATP-binding protein [Peptostreptococcaceae bacterium]|nr:ABC transporter ATP-binding protein [Peptostreptococcaceae bacterium]